jgi:hypothetical protein
MPMCATLPRMYFPALFGLCGRQGLHNPIFFRVGIQRIGVDRVDRFFERLDGFPKVGIKLSGLIAQLSQRLTQAYGFCYAFLQASGGGESWRLHSQSFSERGGNNPRIEFHLGGKHGSPRSARWSVYRKAIHSFIALYGANAQVEILRDFFPSTHELRQRLLAFCHRPNPFVIA